jgi:hypothetical protein
MKTGRSWLAAKESELLPRPRRPETKGSAQQGREKNPNSTASAGPDVVFTAFFISRFLFFCSSPLFVQ